MVLSGFALGFLSRAVPCVPCFPPIRCGDTRVVSVGFFRRSVAQVSVQLTDYDAYGADDYAGCLFLDLSSCPIDRDQNNIPPPPRPTWREFFLEKPGDSSGELLVSYQVSSW